MREPLAVAVAGVAGSGKSTLGRALACRVGAALLDLDTLTNPLLDALGEDLFGGHWLASPHAASIRRGRYAALTAAAAEVLGTAGRVVLVAPFTAELRGGAEWRELTEALAPTRLRMVQIAGDARLFAGRRAGRGAVRDRYRPADRTDAPAAPAAVPLITVDAALPTDAQLEQVVLALGRDGASAEG